MKKLFTCVFVLMVFVVFGQKEKVTEDQSKAEVFISKKGSMIEKTFTVIGEIGKASFTANPTPLEVLKIKDLIKNDSIFCVRMTAYSGSGAYTTSSTGYIDADELPNVIAFLKMVEQKYLPTVPPSNNVEVQYECDSGFEIACFNSKNKWQLYIKPKRFESGQIFLDKNSITNILSTFQSAQDFIKK